MVRAARHRGGDDRSDGRPQARIPQGRELGAEGAGARARCLDGRGAEEARQMTVAIRSYSDDDHAAVRDLFIRVNRELAPADLREAFEGYIERSLAEEIDRIGAY